MRARPLAAAAVALLLAGCTPPSPTPSATLTPTEPEFVVTTTERPDSYDPAAAVTNAGAIVSLNVFQRLLISHAEKGDLKPDAATDCLYTSATAYECTLPPELVFSNGHPLTASDVKFSIERAYRLGIDQTSVPLLNSLQRVEQVDDLTVRFHLKWADTQFGYALAAPAASIVDEEVYDPDAVRPDTALPAGSGPYALTAATDQALTFGRTTTYRGATPAGLERVRLTFAADSPAVEQVLADGATDVVWRGLEPAALARLDAEMEAGADEVTKRGFTRVPMPGARLHRLMWNPASRHVLRSDLRTVVARSLQADRTLRSLVPPLVPGSVASFPVGGRPSIAPTKGQRVKLTLSYAARTPGEADLARTVRDRLENNGGLSVQLVADTPNADLRLTDRPAWVNTAFGWLQPYLDDPLPGSGDKLSTLDQNARETGDAATRAALLAEIQQQASADLTVLPLSLGAETLFIGADVRMEGDAFGPAWQLGLWGFRRA